MTIDAVIQAVEDQTGQKVAAGTKLSDMGMDSLEFLDLVVRLGVPDAAVPGCNTVHDLYQAIQ
jgi:acyl carrier protein